MSTGGYTTGIDVAVCCKVPPSYQMLPLRTWFCTNCLFLQRREIKGFPLEKFRDEGFDGVEFEVVMSGAGEGD